jgi:opacity protein-like surface antigen
MRIITAFIALVALAACASAPVSAPSEPSASQSDAPSYALVLFRAAGRPDAPNRGEVERILGAPDVAREDGAGAALTYRYEQCALLLLFTADGRNELRLAEAHPGPRRTGAAAPSLEQCAAEASARRP